MLSSPLRSMRVFASLTRFSAVSASLASSNQISSARRPSLDTLTTACLQSDRLMPQKLSIISSLIMVISGRVSPKPA